MVTRDLAAPRLSHLRDTMNSPLLSKVVMTPSTVQTIAHEAQASVDGTETGGILLGISDRDTLTIRHAGGPGPRAIRRRDFFQRDLEHAQRLGDQAFDADRSIWIGDWHTHLHAPPVPSARDLATYRRLLADPELGFERFVAVILSSVENGWTRPTMAVWLIAPDGLTAVAPMCHPARETRPSSRQATTSQLPEQFDLSC